MFVYEPIALLIFDRQSFTSWLKRPNAKFTFTRFNCWLTSWIEWKAQPGHCHSFGNEPVSVGRRRLAFSPVFMNCAVEAIVNPSTAQGRREGRETGILPRPKFQFHPIHFLVFISSLLSLFSPWLLGAEPGRNQSPFCQFPIHFVVFASSLLNLFLLLVFGFGTWTNPHSPFRLCLITFLLSTPFCSLSLFLLFLLVVDSESILLTLILKYQNASCITCTV